MKHQLGVEIISGFLVYFLLQILMASFERFFVSDPKDGKVKLDGENVVEFGDKIDFELAGPEEEVKRPAKFLELG